MALEEWIQLGCGDKPYICEEKNATFPSACAFFFSATSSVGAP